ncbi:hypothetical protein A2160_00930 [Candidatus Beckwithbacteria bacterium RBG_13_42_9]|uniref:ABC transporter permease n=1 Tax=Candidatus Beckwithbacteria bacterium RBG_13_42_9 TaxID=1797457 RepID=A0A1F5E386_9BACT|nr:MAG: hypothetical protein A2160_00930 [Candidatus Beckwithbacteria bacterium RBG_13_42_9]
MNLKRYFSLFGAFFRFSFYSETAFRGNLLFWTTENLLWLGLSFIGIELIYGQVNNFAGWDKNQAFLIIFISALFHDLCWTFIFRNLHEFSGLVREGRLDQLLLRPVNLRFLLSCRIFEFDHYVRIILEFFLIYRYTLLAGGYFSLSNLVMAISLFACGLIIFYSLFFALTVTNIWFINLANLIDFFNDLKEVGSKPTYIFKEGLFIFFAYILPVGFIATFPAEALLGKITLEKVILAPFLAFVFLWGSQKFFTFALKYYSSASS